MNLRRVLIKGQVELLYAEIAKQINQSIHLKYVTPEGLNDPEVAAYLSKGDDVTIKVRIDQFD